MPKVLLALCLALIALTDARADLVYLNSDLVTVSSIDATRVNAKYRPSNGNFDQSLDPGTGTLASVLYLQHNAGNIVQLNQRTYDFSLTHIAGQGFIYDLAGTNGSTMSYGTFTSPPPGQNTPYFPLGSGIPLFTPGQPFNSLELEFRADVDGARVEFGSLNFVSSLTVADDDLIRNGFVEQSTATPGLTPPRATQRIYADTDLAMIDWELTGTVMIERPVRGSEERVRFTISGQQVTAAVAVPEAGAFAACGLFAGGFLLVRRRRNRRYATR